MFKKIHSNRDPQATLFSELKKEFAVYFYAAGSCARRFTDRYPRLLFGLMILMMVTSLILSFTVFRVKEPPGKITQKPLNNLSPVSNGFDLILQTGIALKETISLKKQVDSLTAKKTLTNIDSVVLEKDLDRLQQINSHINKKQ